MAEPELSPDTADSAHPDIARMSFEEALEELERIVQALEAGKGRLEDAIASYERGARLKQHCEARLRDAQMKVERILPPRGEHGLPGLVDIGSGDEAGR
jgi:exodeoxyribonuclease VII small subunit